MGKHRLEDRELKESARQVEPTTTRPNTTFYYATVDHYVAQPPRQPAQPQPSVNAEPPRRLQPRPYPQRPESQRPVARHPEPQRPEAPRGGQRRVQTQPAIRPAQPPQPPRWPTAEQNHQTQQQPQRRQTVRSQPLPRYPGAEPAAGNPRTAETQDGAPARTDTRAGTKRRSSHALPSMRRKKDDLFERSFRLCARCGEHVYILASSCKHCDAAA